MAFPNLWSQYELITAAKLNDWNTKLSVFEKDTVNNYGIAAVSRIGIGTSNPQNILSISSSSTQNIDLTITSSNSTVRGGILLQHFGDNGSSTPNFSHIGVIQFNGKGTNNTTIYSSAAIDSTIGTNGTLNAAGDLRFFTNTGSGLSEKLRITPEGRLVVNGSSINGVLSIYNSNDSLTNSTLVLENETSSSSFSRVGIQTYAYNAGGYFSGLSISSFVSRGSKSSPQALQAGDRMLAIFAHGYNGSIYNSAFSLMVFADANFSSSNMNTVVNVNIAGPNEGSTSTKWKFEGTGAFSFAAPVNATPSNPAASSEVKVYLRNNKIIFMYNDAGTIRYKYLDLTGTGVTWVHTTTAP